MNSIESPSFIIDRANTSDYCQYSGDYNPSHFVGENLTISPVIHGGLICTSSLNTIQRNKQIKIERIKVLFKEPCYAPSKFTTKLLPNLYGYDSYEILSNNIQVALYNVYSTEQTCFYSIKTESYSPVDSLSFNPIIWDECFKINTTYKIDSQQFEKAFPEPLYVTDNVVNSFAILSRIVGMYSPGLSSTSISYDIYYKRNSDKSTYFSIVNHSTSLSILRLVVKSPIFIAQVVAKTNSPIRL
tara:strand:- start:1139 stop:1867 length:729 start_codon:yes stop_codon:yes gene_type:complete